jgi:hypothetical protein
MDLYNLRHRLILESDYPLRLFLPETPEMECNCNNPLCPVCVQRQRYRQRSALKNRLGSLQKRNFLALSSAYPDTDWESLRSRVGEQQRGLRRLLKDYSLRHSRGHFASLEIVPSGRDSRFNNPHFHGLIELKHSRQNAVDWESLQREYLPDARSFLVEPVKSLAAYSNYIVKATQADVWLWFTHDAEKARRYAEMLFRLPRYASGGILICTGRNLNTRREH